MITNAKTSHGHDYLEKQFATTPRSTVSECWYHNFYSRPPESIFDGGAQLTTVVLELASSSASETSYDHGCLEEQFTTNPRNTVSECGYHNFYSRPPESIFDGGAQLTTVVLEYHNFYSRPPES